MFMILKQSFETLLPKSHTTSKILYHLKKNCDGFICAVSADLLDTPSSFSVSVSVLLF